MKAFQFEICDDSRLSLWVAYLCLTFEEEFEGINAVCNGTSYDGKPVKDQGWLIWVLEQFLLKDVREDGDSDDADKCNKELERMLSEHVDFEEVHQYIGQTAAAAQEKAKGPNTKCSSFQAMVNSRQ